MATKEAIKQLKDSWVKDPCWDIETTEGFEDHIDELKHFRIVQEEIWNKERLEREELEKNKTFQQRVEDLRQEIKDSDHRLDILLGRLGADSQLELALIGSMQIKATLLLAEQVSIVVDLLEPLAKPFIFLSNKGDDRDGLAESVRIWGSGS